MSDSKLNGATPPDPAQAEQDFNVALAKYVELFSAQFLKPNPDPSKPPILEIDAEQVIQQIAFLAARLETIQSLLLMPAITPPQYNAAYLMALKRKIADFQRPIGGRGG